MANSSSSGANASLAGAVELSPEVFVYAERVRRALARLRPTPPDAEDAPLSHVVGAVSEVARFDVEAPPSHARREVRLLKTAFKRLARWYLQYLAGQLNVFGSRVVRLGEVLATRTEQLEARSQELGDRIGAVERRLSRLEGHMAPDRAVGTAVGNGNGSRRNQANGAQANGAQASGGQANGAQASGAEAPPTGQRRPQVAARQRSPRSKRGR